MLELHELQVVSREVLVAYDCKRYMLSSPYPTTTAEGSTHDQFVAQNALIMSTTSRCRNWNILQCTSDIDDPKDFLLWFARLVDVPLHDEAVRVVKTGPGLFAVLYAKNGQRKDVSIPGLLHRYTLPNRGRHQLDEQKASLIQSMDEMQGPGYSMILAEALDESSAIDVVATCRNMSRSQLLFLRLQAHMKKPKDLSPFERAITSGYGDLKELMVGREDSGGAWVYLDDPTIRKLDTYGDTSNGYHFFDDMGISCKYLEADGSGGSRWVTSSMHDLITQPLHQKRTILFYGAANSGKSKLAGGLAWELSYMYNPDMSLSELGFGYFRSIEIAKQFTSQMSRRKVVVFDDVKAGAARRKNVDLGEFLFNLLDVENATQPACRNTDLNFPGEMFRIFTTNVEPEVFLSDGGELVDPAQLDSLYRRLFVIHVSRKLYTDDQAVELSRFGEEELQEALVYLRSARH